MLDYFEEDEILPTKLSRKTILRVFKVAFDHKLLFIMFLSSTILLGLDVGFDIIIFKQLLDVGIIPGNMEMVWLYIFLYGINWAAWSILAFFMIYSGVRLETYILYNLRKQMFEHIQGLSFSYFDKTPLGWIMARIISDASSVSGTMIWAFQWILREGSVMVSSIFFIIIIDWRLSLIVLQYYLFFYL